MPAVRARRAAANAFTAAWSATRHACAPAAPKRASSVRRSRGAPPGTWQYFCLDHVREFNAGYSWKGDLPGATDRWERATRAFAKNAYAGAFDDELNIFGRGATEMPSRAAARWTAAERTALRVLNLGEKASAADIRARYKALVRRFHPDMNGGDRSHEARLQAVLDAYSELKGAVQAKR